MSRLDLGQNGRYYQFQLPCVWFVPDVFRKVETSHEVEYQGEWVLEGAVYSHEWDDVPM